MSVHRGVGVASVSGPWSMVLGPFLRDTPVRPLPGGGRTTVRSVVWAGEGYPWTAPRNYSPSPDRRGVPPRQDGGIPKIGIGVLPPPSNHQERTYCGRYAPCDFTQGTFLFCNLLNFKINVKESPLFLLDFYICAPNEIF